MESKRERSQAILTPSLGLSIVDHSEKEGYMSPVDIDRTQDITGLT